MRRLLVAWCVLLACPIAPATPNIVIILADDLGVGDLGCYNPDSKIATPSIDAIARDGMIFKDAHSPSAVCTPTRYALLTGRYAWRTRLERGVLMGYAPLLVETDRLTLASLARASGYATGCFGKWHLGLGDAERTEYAADLKPGPLEIGFDEFYGIPASLDMAPYVYVHNHSVTQAPSDRIDGSSTRRSGGGGYWRAGPIAPDFRHQDVLPRTIDQAIDFVERVGGRPVPYFLYVPLSAPHTPWLPDNEATGTSDAGPYGDFVHQMDREIGRLVRAIDEVDHERGTLLIITSDNGAHWTAADIERYGHLANGDVRGQKADIHEGGHRIPLIVRWRGSVPPASESGETVCLVDLFATQAHLLRQRVRPNAGEDSVSMLPLLTGAPPRRERREAIVHHSLNGTFAIRRGKWKLIDGLGSGGFTSPQRRTPEAGEPPGQLYDLTADPRETQNLYHERPEIVHDLRALLATYRAAGRSVHR